MIVAGLGFRTACTAAEIVSLVDRVALSAGVEAGALAVPAFKAGAPELARAAERLGLEIRPVSSGALVEVQSRCLSRSTAALTAVGVASVAEACALASAGPDAWLLAPKTSSGAATCALATSDRAMGQGR